MFGTVVAFHEMQTVGVGDRETSLRLNRDTVGVTEQLVIETRSSMLESDETGEAVFIRGSGRARGVLSVAEASTCLVVWYWKLKLNDELFDPDCAPPVKKQYL